MNRITRERIKKQREAKGFTGIQIKDLGKFFKRKEIQPSTPSGVKPKTDKSQPSTTTTTPSATKTTTKPQGRAEQMNANAAGNKQSTPEATDSEVKAWKARKPNSMKPESYKGYRNVGAALNAWRKEDPRKN